MFSIPGSSYTSMFLCLFVLGSLLGSAQSSADYKTMKDVVTDSMLSAIRKSSSDSERAELYTKLMSKALMSNPGEAEKWFDQGIVYAEKNGDREQILRMKVLMLSGWNQKAAYDKTLKEAPILEKQIGSVKRARTKLGLYLAWANAAAKSSKYDLSQQLYKKTILLAKQAKQLDVEIMALNNFSMMYNDMSKWSEMRDLLNEVIRLAQKNNMRPEETMGRFNLALVESNQGNYGKAIDYLTASLRVFDSLGNKYGMALCYSSLGTNYQKTRAYDRAIQSLRKGYAIRKQMGETLGYAKVRRTMAQVYLETSALDSGLIAINESINIFDSVKSVSDLQESFKIKAELLSRKNDFASAFKALQQHVIWKDSMHKESADKQLQQQILMLKANYTDSLILARESSLSTSRKGNVALSVILAAFLIGGGIISAKRKRKQASLQEKEAESRRQLAATQAELSAVKKQLNEQIRFDLEALRSRLTSEKAWQESYWNEFLLAFSHVYPAFFSRVRNGYPDLTPHELRICALVKMNLSLDEMGEILGISGESVRKARYRIYKKMGLGSDQELIDTLFSD
jgi:DNA-binding CsgD family transcriptional regulator